MLATVIFDLTVAILLGVAYSAILYIAKSSQIGVSFSDIDANKLRTVEGKPPVLETTGVVYVTGSRSSARWMNQPPHGGSPPTTM